MLPDRVLVTGGAGFVGSHLCDRLVADGCEVVVLDDLSRGQEEWLPVGARLVRADVRDRDAVLAAVTRAAPGAVVHLAALHFIPAVDDAPELAQAINVEGTRNVLDAAEAAGVQTIVFASTAAVYGDTAGAIDETVVPAPIDLYGRTKLEGERLLESLAARTGARCVAARLFNVVGPRETNPHVLPEIVEQVRGGATALALGNLEPQRDYIDARDVATAIVTLLRTAAPGKRHFNVGSGRPVSVADLVAACSTIAGRELVVHRDPARVRRVDRMCLLSDPAALEGLGWTRRHTLESTLSELLTTSPEASS